MSEPDAPRYELEDVANGFHDLHAKLLSGQGLPAMPFWLSVRDSGYKITEANRNHIALGLLLCLEVRAVWGR